MKIKIDMARDGLYMFFKPYEVLGWDRVWNSSESKPVGSFDVFKHIKFGLGPGKTISRASVIFFLNRQVDLGFMAWKDATGKGGHRRLYYPLVNMTELTLAISRRMAEKIRDLIYQAIENDKRRGDQ
jgi:hypothetical protein